MKKVNFYVLMYFVAILMVACCVSSCSTTKSTVNPCEHFVSKQHRQNPHDLLPFKH